MSVAGSVGGFVVEVAFANPALVKALKAAYECGISCCCGVAY